MGRKSVESSAQDRSTEMISGGRFRGLRRWIRRWAGERRRERRPMVEPLEPRMLLSAALDWVTPIDGTEADLTHDVVTAVNGDVLVAGTFESTVDFDPSAGETLLTAPGSSTAGFVARYSAAGELVFALPLLPTSGSGDRVLADGLAEASNGDIYVAGEFKDAFDADPGAAETILSPTGFQDPFVLRFDASGTLLDTLTLGGVGFDSLEALALDANDNVYLAGGVFSTIDLDPSAGTTEVVPSTNDSGNPVQTPFVVRYDADFNFDWGHGFEVGGNSQFLALAPGADGSAVAAGTFATSIDADPGAGTTEFTSTDFSDAVAVKLDTNGDFVWGKGFGTEETEQFTGAGVDEAGNVYLGGSFTFNLNLDPGGTDTTLAGSSLFLEPFAMSLDGDGNFRWGAEMPGVSEGEARDLAVRVDPAGPDTVFVGGYFAGTADFDPGAGTLPFTDHGGGDAFAWALNADGTLREAFHVGGPQYDDAFAIDGTADGVHLGGRFGGFNGASADFDPGLSVFEHVSEDIGGYAARYTFGDFGAVTGTVFLDADADGTRDAFDPGEGGVTVYVDANDNGALDDGEKTAVTGADGAFGIGGLTPGDYTVRAVAPAQATQTLPAAGAGRAVTVVVDQAATGADFGFAVDPSTVSGVIYDDSDGDGVLGDGEPGVEGVTVFLDVNGNGTADDGEPSATTGTDGAYTITDVLPGEYDVRQVVPEGQRQVAPLAAPMPGVTLLSTTEAGDAAGGVTSDTSRDGRYVVVGSNAGFVLVDTATGERRIISETGTGGRVSDNGRYVVFMANSNLATGVDSPERQVFLKNMQTGDVRLISEAVGGGAGNGFSDLADISGDGSTVAFQSTSTDLVAGGTSDGRAHVYLYDVETGALSLVTPPGSAESSASSSVPVLSADGDVLVFRNDGDSDFAGETSGQDIVLYDRTADAFELISREDGADGQPVGTLSGSPTVSDDGRFVAFTTRENLDPADNFFNSDDVYLRDRQDETTTWVSPGADGSHGGFSARNPVLSGNGEAVFFTYFGGLVPEDTNDITDIYRRDLASGELSLASVAMDGQAPDTFNSQFPSGSDRITAGTDPDVYVFASDASDIVDATDGNIQRDIFRVNRTGAIAAEVTAPGSALSGFDLGNGPLVPFGGGEDGDGGLDLVIASADADSLSFGANNGDATFTETTVNFVTIGLQIAGPIGVGDFDGDGDLDLEAGDLAGNGIYHFVNNGDGTFSQTGSTLTGGTPIADGGNAPAGIATGDFNGDGFADMAVANSGSNNVTIFHGRNSGVQDQASIAVGTNPRGIAAGDLDGDGDLDLVVANADDGTGTVLTNDGAGVFTAGVTLALGNDPQHAELVDLDGTNGPDLVVLNEGDDNVGVLLNDGAGGFGAMTTEAVGDNVQDLAVADLNGDGAPDVAISQRDANQVAVLFSDATGDVASTTTLTTDQFPGALAIGDVTGDEIADIVVTTRRNAPPANQPDAVNVFPGNGDGTFGELVRTEMGSDPEDLVLFDIDFVGDPVPGTLAGRVFDDPDGNGSPDTLDQLLEGRTVYVDANSNGMFDDGETSAVSDADGEYTLTLPPGDYLVRQVLPENWVQTTPADDAGFERTVTPGVVFSGLQFGSRDNSPSITGQVFFDRDADATNEAGEPGLNAWPVRLVDDSDGSTVDTVQTAFIDLDGDEAVDAATEFGVYRFKPVDPGTYRIELEPRRGWGQTTTAPLPTVTVGGQETAGPDVGVDHSPRRKSAFEDGGFGHFAAKLGTVRNIVAGADNRAIEMLESSPAAFEGEFDLTQDNPALTFDYRFTNVGDGDALVVNVTGETETQEVFRAIGTDFVGGGFVTAGPIDLEAFSGETVTVELRLESVNAVNAVIEVDDVEVVVGEPTNLDVDGNGLAAIETDGILIVRHMFGFSGASLTAGALAGDATRNDAARLTGFLAGDETGMLDVDGDGSARPLSDGILIARHLSGFSGEALVDGAVAEDATRRHPAVVAAFLEGYLPSSIGESPGEDQTLAADPPQPGAALLASAWRAWQADRDATAEADAEETDPLADFMEVDFLVPAP